MKVYFEETQYLPKTVLGILLAIGFFANGLQIGRWIGDDFNNFLPKLGLLALINLILIAVFLFFRQKTKLTDSYLQIQYTPFQQKTIPLERIAHMDLVNHISILGYGVRKTPNASSYNISAKQGVLLKSIANKKLIIGSRRHKELLAALTQALSFVSHKTV